MKFLAVVVFTIIAAITFANANSLKAVKKIEEPPKLAAAGSSPNNSPTSNYYVLALIKCNSSGPHTLHGLWPSLNKYSHNPEFCNSSYPFTWSQIEDLRPQLETYWLACPGWGQSTTSFLTHEWDKHGSCAKGMDEHQFFKAGLQLYFEGDWKQYCSKWKNECKVHVYPPTMKVVGAAPDNA